MGLACEQEEWQNPKATLWGLGVRVAAETG